MYKAEEELGENADYLFPEIDNLDFEADLDKAFEEIEALHREKNEDDSLEKAVSTEDIASAKTRGLVPKSGNWQKPGRWVRPEDADVPVDEGKKPRKKAILPPEMESNYTVPSEDTVRHLERLLGRRDFQEDTHMNRVLAGQLWNYYGEDKNTSDAWDSIPELEQTKLLTWAKKVTDSEEPTRQTLSSDVHEDVRKIFNEDFKISDFQDMYSIGLEDFSTEITQINTDQTFLNDELTISIDIKGDFGVGLDNHVGSMIRGFSRQDGKLIVTHYGFMVEKNYQGKGIATDINEHVEDEYERLGVSEIQLQANANIGGYAWARQGFDFSSHKSTGLESQLESYKTRFSGLAEKQLASFFPVDEVDRLLEEVDGFEHAWQFAAWNPTNKPYGQHLGKELMLGSSWYAEKILDKESKGYKIGKGYFAAKRNEKNTS